MFCVTGPVMSNPSAWRGEATNWMPNRPKSNTTVLSTFTSASQPLQPPALTWRSFSEWPNKRLDFSSSACRQLQRLALQEQVLPPAHGQAVILVVPVAPARACLDAVGAAETTAQVQPRLFRSSEGDGPGRTGIGASLATVAAALRIDDRPAAKALRQHRQLQWIPAGPMPLTQSLEQQFSISDTPSWLSQLPLGWSTGFSRSSVRRPAKAGTPTLS